MKSFMTISFCILTSGIILGLMGCGGYKLLPITGLSQLVGSYEAVVPCADCKEIRYKVDIRPEEVFVMEEMYVDSEEATSSFYHIGDVFLAEGKVQLVSSGQVKLELGRIDENGLVQIGEEGEVKDPEQYRFTRRAGSAFEDRSLPLTGMFSIDPQSGEFAFQECRVKQTYTLTLSEQAAFIEEEYPYAVKELGTPVYLELIGKLPMGSKKIYVEDVLSMTPGQGCR